MKIELDDDQALVLYEWLRRFDETNSYPVQDEAEEFVFWAVHGQLEKALSEPFRADYRELVAKARARVRANRSAG